MHAWYDVYKHINTIVHDTHTTHNRWIVSYINGLSSTESPETEPEAEILQLPAVANLGSQTKVVTTPNENDAKSDSYYTDRYV